LRRFFERILLSYIKDTPQFTTHSSQGGFKAGYSTYSHVILAQETALKNSQATHVFLDLSNAYDRVPHHLILDILKKRGVPNRVFNLMYSLMCRNLTSTIIINQSELSGELSRLRGLFQGSILAPLLFNLLIDPLAQHLHAIDGNPAIPADLFYADDIKLTGTNLETLQIKLDACAEWAEASGMRFGLSKCQVVSPTSAQLFLGLDLLTQVDTYKYLGFPFTASGIDFLTFYEEKTRKFINFLRFYLPARLSWDYPTRAIILKTFFLSKLNYGLPPIFWWMEQKPPDIKKSIKKTLKSVWSEIHSFLYGISYSNRQHILQKLSGLSSYQFFIDFNKASLSYQASKWSQCNPIQALNIPGINSELYPRCLSSDWYVTWSSSERPTRGSWKKLVFEKKQKTFECAHALCGYLLPTAACTTRGGWDFIYQSRSEERL
jgi:hypothetical protein